MDKHFLEFWGNFQLNAAKGQRQMEDMSEWMKQGLRGFEDLTAMFRKSYGLEDMTEGTNAYLKSWKKAAEDFQKSSRDYLDLMVMVPKDEHLELVEKYENLKKKVADQDETIRHLRMLLEEKGTNQGEATKGFEDLLKRQNRQFQELMESFSNFIKKETPSVKED